MYRSMLKSKIHRLTVTQKKLDYEGSLTLDCELIAEADLHPFEMVQVANISNGHRFETYIIEGKPHSGAVCLNGAAARLGEIGDLIIVISTIMIPEDEIRTYSPRIVLVDAFNKPIKKLKTAIKT